MEGLKTELRLYETSSIASLGWDKVRFRVPVVAGDTLRLRFRFLTCRGGSKPDRGVVKVFYTGRRMADGAVVLEILGTHIFRR